MFPTDKEYKKFVQKLNQAKLRLTCGNCGIFAFALKEVFKDGQLFNIGDFSHILLEHDNKFYDGKKIYKSFDELRKDTHWNYYYEDEYDHYDLEENDPNNTYKKIKRNTCYSIDKEYFINIIKKSFNMEAP